MKKYFDVLRRCPLFSDIADAQLLPMLSCLGAKTETYQKAQTILAEGSPARCFGIVLSGAVQIIRMDYDGNRSIMTNLEPSQLFGESFACAEIHDIPVDVVAAEPTEVMLLDAHRITKSCSNACSFHHQMIFNLMKVVAAKNLAFHRKLEITSCRTTREKLLTYLSHAAKENGSNSFTIPYDRQALADYLGVDRSGLSVEIGRLRREGILLCEKSHFTLLS